jgi:hypothetical protein
LIRSFKLGERFEELDLLLDVQSIDIVQVLESLRNGTRNAHRSWGPVLLDVDNNRLRSLLNWSLSVNRVSVRVDLRSILRLSLSDWLAVSIYLRSCSILRLRWSDWLAVGIYLRSWSITRLLLRNLIAPLIDGALTRVRESKSKYLP